MLWRLVNDGYLDLKNVKIMKTGIIASARRLGYDNKLYTPTPEAKQYATFGRYIKLVERLKDLNVISKGKYEELLLDGFRSDIVYGLDANEEELYD